MSTNTAEGIESSPHDDRSTDEKVDALIEVVEELQAENEHLRDRVDELEDTVEELQEQTAKERAQDRKRLTELEDVVEEGGFEDVNPTHQAGEPDSYTPIERLSQEGTDAVAEHVGPSVERAITLFENLPKWGRETPRGIVLKPNDRPRELLETARDEQLAWQQYYRAAKALERLSKGAVTFFSHNEYGKTLALHRERDMYKRVSGEDNSHSHPSLVEG